MSKFIEIDFSLININHIVKVSFNEIQKDGSGDWYIDVTLSTGEVIEDAEVSYEAMMKRFEQIKLILQNSGD